MDHVFGLSRPSPSLQWAFGLKIQMRPKAFAVNDGHFERERESERERERRMIHMGGAWSAGVEVTSPPLTFAKVRDKDSFVESRRG